MGMGPAGVFIVESPGVEEIAGQYAEGPIVTEMLKLLRMPYVSRRVESRVDLERDASIYRQRPFDVLLFSAHGAPGKLALTTGEEISVGELLQLYRGRTNTAVVFSSCEVLAGDEWPTILSNKGSPDYVLGYESVIYWSNAALASVMLMFGLAHNQFGKLLSTLLAIHASASVSICGYIRTADSDKHQWFSTEAFINHAKEAAGVKTDVELSALIAGYMLKEKERFKQRSDEYFRQAADLAEADRVGEGKYRDNADRLQRIQRPNNPDL